MCSVVVMPDGRQLSSLGQLRDRWTVLPVDTDGEDYGDDVCLCAVDVYGVLERAGVEWEEDDDTGDYLIEGL